MNLSLLLDLFGEKHPNIDVIIDLINDKKHIRVGNLVGSAKSVVSGKLFSNTNRNLFCILDDLESAGYFYHDLTQLLGNNRVFFLPPSFKGSIKHNQKDPANEILRTEVLKQLNESKEPCIVVSSPEGIAEQVISTDLLQERTIRLAVGEKIDIPFIRELLYEYGFEHVDFVYEPGQFSIRGSIIDVFSFSHEYPYRIDLFGDEVESIRTFDVSTQLSKEKKTEIAVIPHIQQTGNTVSIFNFFNDDAVFLFENLNFCIEKINSFSEEYLDNNSSQFSIINGHDIIHAVSSNVTIEFQHKSFFEKSELITFDQSSQPVFHKNFELITENLIAAINNQYKIYILSDSNKQIERLNQIFNDRGDNIPFTAIEKTLHEGFIDNTLKICCYTDHQIFDRYHKYNLKSDNARSGKLAIAIKEISQLQIGDYVVHSDHGIGRFGGLIKMEKDGKMQEVIKITYKDNDILFVSIHALHRISKYRGKEGAEPHINKLGTGAWEKLKNKTKKHVKDIARELIQLYAKRRENKGFSFSKDSFLQQELEASFIYEDTPDQLKSTVAVKKDMENIVPMDRLICGDVGFGKTEIAIRAAFKAAADNKQTAIMVPTTVLALQHYQTFKNRLKDFPCTIEYLSRARSPKQVKEIKSRLANGEIDIIIGTHRLISKDILFKDLGLLIIDEEQKFGVSVKEKIRQMKTDIDTLTLTATPIPRTLQFSLMGARDLSVINTPPPNRYPVQTEIHTFNRDIIEDAIRFELSRNGQVFFINNRINNLFELENLVKQLIPEARVAIGHGQMDPDALEKIILDFIDHEYDVLIATTIVESGIDIPNVNTILINNAQNFGLSDLHQLRGRVGRSNKKAFCYLLAPPLSTLPTDSKRRLQAIETFSELGSGIHIAMQDLDIRGAGNLLGGEQSGFITDLGFETYHKILDEAVQELREEEFSELFSNDREEHVYISDCLFETDLEIMFPSSYIENISERMSFYRRINNAKEESELTTICNELSDRFGKIPDQSIDLINVVRSRWLAMNMGLEKLVLKNNRLSGFFGNNLPVSFYESPTFNKIIHFLQDHPHTTQLKEKGGKRLVSFTNIKSIKEALDIFQRINSIEV